MKKGLFDAVKSNDLVAVKKALKENPESVNDVCHRYKRTCLYIACGNGFLDIVKVLLKCDKIDVNLADYEGWTPLHIASINKHIKVFEALLAHPLININRTNIFNMSILWICNNETFQILSKSKNFDINYKNKHGQTPLCQAYELAHIKLMEILLSNGAVCVDWKSWLPKWIPDKKRQVKAKEIMSRWRSYLPEWSLFNHKMFYPKEFEDLAITCMIVWNRLETMHSLRIYKDIKCLLVKYIANNWRKKIDA